MKTALEHFEDFDDPTIANMATSNHIKQGKDGKLYDSLSEAVSGGFNWSVTPQGHEFWNRICSLPDPKKADYELLKTLI